MHTICSIVSNDTRMIMKYTCSQAAWKPRKSFQEWKSAIPIDHKRNLFLIYFITFHWIPKALSKRWLFNQLCSTQRFILDSSSWRVWDKASKNRFEPGSSSSQQWGETPFLKGVTIFLGKSREPCFRIVWGADPLIPLFGYTTGSTFMLIENRMRLNTR